MGILNKKMSKLNIRNIFKDSLSKIDSMINRLDTQLGVNSNNSNTNATNPSPSLSLSTNNNPHAKKINTVKETKKEENKIDTNSQNITIKIDTNTQNNTNNNDKKAENPEEK